MSNTPDKKLNFPRIYTIHSQKGGVGKTSIAVAIAGFAAITHNKKTLIIDADLTGTSLIDIPNFPPLKKGRYFNDLILANPADFQSYTSIMETPDELTTIPNKQRLDQFYHKITTCKNISYFPASPDLNDIQKTIPLISQEDHLRFFRLRLEDILATAIMDGFEVIIIDHPPGLYGISTASLKMVLDQKKGGEKTQSRLSKLLASINNSANSFSCHAIFCTTSDPVDYRALFPSLSTIFSEKLREKIDNNMETDVFLNKGVKEPMSGHFDGIFAWNHIFNDLKRLPGDRKRNKKLLETLKQKQKTGNSGACAGEYVDNFSMEKIFLTIDKMQQQGDYEKYSGMEGWCTQLGSMVSLIP